MVNNLLVGQGRTIAGPSQMTANLVVSGESNARARRAGGAGGPGGGADPLLGDRAGFDYRLLAGSPAIDAGVDPATAWEGATAAAFENQGPGRIVPRAAAGRPDIGAFEFSPR